MAEMPHPIAEPTWLANIRNMFRSRDVDHMRQRGIDLATYEGVKANAIRVLGATEPPDASMPPDPDGQWSIDEWTTFKNWILTGYPFGTAEPEVPVTAEGVKIRKNASNLSTEEIDLLRTAFQGIMDRPPEHPQSYFAQAGVHWLPKPTYCLHHEHRYNPWHRAYLHPFEEALRSVPGCAAVTLPYWDITTPPPSFMYDPPFASYTLPQDIGEGFAAGYTTSRYTPSDIQSNVDSYRIPQQISEALSQSVWSQFNNRIIRAHDNGHVSIGETVSQQDVASYDPIFWLFHANLDRLWWLWQQRVSATTLTGFLSTVKGSTDWLRVPPFNTIPPFSATADMTIDLNAIGVDYEHPPVVDALAMVSETFGSLKAAELHGLHLSQRASVRVKGINRLNIPGTFTVHIKAANRTVGKQTFFQARNPRACSACVKKGTVDIDIDVDIVELSDGPLSVVIEPNWPDAIGGSFPISAAGDPTVNMRLLLE